MHENMEKLSSGYRINKSADDAAGLAISDTLNGKVRSLDQAKRNANDGVSVIQVAEGSMNEITNILVRMRELATQSASDTISNLERSYANKEYTQLVDEIDRITNSTEFNGLQLLKGKDANPSIEDQFTIHIGAGNGVTNNTDTISIDLDGIKIDARETLGLNGESEIGPSEVPENGQSGGFSRTTAAEKLNTIDNAIKKVAANRAELGAKQSRLGSTINNLGIQIENFSTSKSRIKDVDFADETAKFTQNNILSQAGASILTQANSQPNMALGLLQG
jgi:flagellin